MVTLVNQLQDKEHFKCVITASTGTSSRVTTGERAQSGWGMHKFSLTVSWAMTQPRTASTSSFEFTYFHVLEASAAKHAKARVAKLS